MFCLESLSIKVVQQIVNLNSPFVLYLEAIMLIINRWIRFGL